MINHEFYDDEKHILKVLIIIVIQLILNQRVSNTFGSNLQWKKEIITDI